MEGRQLHIEAVQVYTRGGVAGVGASSFCCFCKDLGYTVVFELGHAPVSNI